MDKFGQFMMTLMLVFLEYVYFGWIGSFIYNWFIAITFSVATINVPQAIGLVIVGKFFCKDFDIPTKKNLTTAEIWDIFLTKFAVATILWGVGFGFQAWFLR